MSISCILIWTVALLLLPVLFLAWATESRTTAPPAMTHPKIINALNYAMTTTGCSRQEAIAFVMKTMVETDISPQKALDAMFGDGTHQQVADQIWTELQPA